MKLGGNVQWCGACTTKSPEVEQTQRNFLGLQEHRPNQVS